MLWIICVRAASSPAKTSGNPAGVRGTGLTVASLLISRRGPFGRGEAAGADRREPRRWCCRMESNHRPPDPQSGALNQLSYGSLSIKSRTCAAHRSRDPAPRGGAEAGGAVEIFGEASRMAGRLAASARLGQTARDPALIWPCPARSSSVAQIDGTRPRISAAPREVARLPTEQRAPDTRLRGRAASGSSSQRDARRPRTR
jgi:hypothetical protein